MVGSWATGSCFRLADLCAGGVQGWSRGTASAPSRRCSITSPSTLTSWATTLTTSRVPTRSSTPVRTHSRPVPLLSVFCCWNPGGSPSMGFPPVWSTVACLLLSDLSSLAQSGSSSLLSQTSCLWLHRRAHGLAAVQGSRAGLHGRLGPTLRRERRRHPQQRGARWHRAQVVGCAATQRSPAESFCKGIAASC